MKLRIELLSDLCTYSGETYNSMVDTDVVYDDYGLPYIQAKRLKGCIREAYQELEEFGVVPAGSTIRVFGEEGYHKSAFTLSNAYLADYEKLISDIEKEEDKAVTHPQNVLRLYTYARTQTAIDLKSGVADKNSLRTMRVIKKGLVFEADFHYQGDLTDEEKKALEHAMESVCHIGYSRTRGLGIVRLNVVDEKNDIHTEVHADEVGEMNKIHYSIKLLAPMLCKAAEGNQARTQIYIEGAKVLGLLAEAMGQEELIVSNAYIGLDGRRCTPLRASLQKKKDQTFDSEQMMEVQDMLFTDKTTEQMSAVKYAFADEEGYLQEVETEINYHHRRPEDKSVGRATGKDGSAFYQLESIRPGQTFYGYILANKKQTETICDIIRVLKNLRMGYGRNAQYGAVKLKIDKVEVLTETKSESKIHDFQVKLNAPVIMFNEYGMYAADIQTLESYLCEALGTEDIKITKSFLKYETIGGFNVTWKRRKPVFTALGMGTICQVHSDAGIDSSKVHNVFLGERVSEGFGEVEITWEENPTYVLRKSHPLKAEKEEQGREIQTDIIQNLHKAAGKKAIEEMARKDADVRAKKIKDIREVDATLSRLIMICKEQDTYEKMFEQVEGITTVSKREIAEKMAEDMCAAMKKDYPYYEFAEDEIYLIYSAVYLKQMKYALRATRKNRR